MVDILRDHIWEDIVSTIREPLVVLDSDLKVVLANHSFYDTFKVQPEETVRQLIYDLGNKQWDIPKLRELLEDILPHKNPFNNYEVVHDFNTIGRRTMLLNARRIEQRVDKGKIILLAIEDITERNRLENLLIDSEERFRRLFETAEDGILLLEKSQGKIDQVNPSVERILGYSSAECTGKDLQDIGVSHNMGDIHEITKTLNNDGIIHCADIELQTKAGESISAEMYCVDKTSLIQCNIRDITERKRAEEALRYNEKRYRDLFNSIRDAIVVADTNRTIIDCNPAFLDLFGFQKEEVLGKQTLSIHENEESFKRLGVAIKAHIGDTGFLHIAHYRKRDGSVFPGETGVFYLLDDEGTMIGYIGLIRDVSQSLKARKDRKKLQAQLTQAQKMESIGNLAGGIAHDFNNILSSVIGYTELSLDEVEKGTDIEGNLQEIYTAGKRAKDLVRQILTIARQSVDEVQPIQVDTIAAEVLHFIRSSIPTTIEIKQNIKSDSLIMGDATQVHQVLMNLFTNAAHAMEGTGGILEFSLKDVVLNRDVTRENPGIKSGNYIEIKVSDTGAGISPEIIDSIFEPYFSTKGPGEGTGLGLAVVQGIVESYDGEITVDSTMGKGTIFSIYLPVIKQRNVHYTYEDEEIPAGTERILFVDDEAPIAKMSAQILERLGYAVTTRTSSVEALELFRTRPDDFDLVITDMAMPDLPGDKLTTELKAIRQNIPVILCTGYSKKTTAEIAIEMGFKAFAYKPIVKADLAKIVRKVLDEAKSKTQA